MTLSTWLRDRNLHSLHDLCDAYKCRLSQRVWDNLAQNSAGHCSVTLSIHAMPDDSLFPCQKWTNTLYIFFLSNSQIWRKSVHLIGNLNCLFYNACSWYPQFFFRNQTTLSYFFVIEYIFIKVLASTSFINALHISFDSFEFISQKITISFQNF